MEIEDKWINDESYEEEILDLIYCPETNDYIDRSSCDQSCASYDAVFDKCDYWISHGD